MTKETTSLARQWSQAIALALILGMVAWLFGERLLGGSAKAAEIERVVAERAEHSAEVNARQSARIDQTIRDIDRLSADLKGLEGRLAAMSKVLGDNTTMLAQILSEVRKR